MSAAAHVSYPADGVGLVLLDNPPKNFGGPELAAAIVDAVERVQAAGSRVVVLASDVPGYFIAHWSLRWLVDVFSGAASAGDRRAASVFDFFETIPLISIAANNGQAWGGGSELSWGCDLRIAAESATYGQPEVAVGIIPGAGGTTRLARLVGHAKCMELVLDCRPITAREALAIGAVNRVVPDERLREEAIDWAAHIARMPAAALAAAKRSVVEGRDMPMAEARRNEGRIFVDIARSDQALAVMREAQARYDAGAESYEALGIARRPRA
jgi:enoyl-CoA hydratase/3-hydroxyacyl-CoA dehydrogenase